MKISIITAVYNSKTTVEEAINSVARQTYPDIEHLVIDGMSTDGSLEQIAANTHERMILHSEEDAGIYDALNKGIRRASGEVIGFVHSDDFLPDEHVIDKIAKTFIANPNVQAVYSNLDYVSQSNSSRVIRHWSTKEFNARRLKYGWMPAHPTLYVRKSAYERYGMFNTDLHISADYDFVLRFFSQMKGTSILLPEVLYKMRLGGVSNKSARHISLKIKEDYYVIRQNKIGGLSTLVWKNLSKIRQFKPSNKTNKR